MIPLFPTSDIRDFDSFAITKLNVPGIVLMENAAIGMFEKVKNYFGNNLNKAGIICGPGNNGGDGFALARHFSNNDFEVRVLFIGNENKFSDDCKTNYQIVKKLSGKRSNIKIKKLSKSSDVKWLKDCEIIFDAMLGSGLKGDLRDPYNSIVKNLNELNKEIVAVDIPTGLNSDTGFTSQAVKAELTITLGEYKKGLFIQKGPEHCGQIELAEIGVGRDYFLNKITDDYLIEPEDALIELPGRRQDLNKYSAGKVITIAGSKEYPGAAALTSKAVLAAGAGASRLAVPESVKKYVHLKTPEIVIDSYGDQSATHLTLDDVKSLEKQLRWSDVLAIGPGLGRDDGTIKAVRKILSEKKYNLAVIDADALFAISDGYYKKLDLSDCILTPHIGEFASLIKISIDKIEQAVLKYGKDFSKNNKTHLVLKGSPTIIFNPSGEAFINTAGNSGMAKFGTGDVLTGVLAGLLAQSDNLESACISGVYLHSLSADLLLKTKTSYSILASDIINNFPKAINFLSENIL